MSVSRRWTMAIEYARQAAELSKLCLYEDSNRIIAAYRAYQSQFEENSMEWWLCTEAFEDEWRYQFPHKPVTYFVPVEPTEVPF